MRLSPVAASLLALAAVLPVSIAATNAALAALTAALLWRLKTADPAPVLKAWRRNPAIWGAAVYVATGLVASACGLDFAHSLHDDAKDLHKLWALLLLVGAFSEEPAPAVWTALAAGFAAVLVVGLGQTTVALLEHQKGFPLPRPHAFVHPVTYGEQLALGLLGALCVSLRPDKATGERKARYALWALIACGAAVLVFNQTRATVFALAAGSAVVLWFEPNFRRRGAWVGVALLAIAVAWEFLPAGDRRSIFRVFLHPDVHETQQVRYYLWATAWKMFRDHPWTGVGPGHYGTLFTTYFAGTLDNERSWSSAHNLYLQQLAERGLVGAAGLAAVLGALVAGAWAGLRRRQDAKTLWAASALVAFLVMNLTETAFQTEQLATLLLFIWAWGTAQPRQAD